METNKEEEIYIKRLDNHDIRFRPYAGIYQATIYEYVVIRNDEVHFRNTFAVWDSAYGNTFWIQREDGIFDETNYLPRDILADVYHNDVKNKL